MQEHPAIQHPLLPPSIYPGLLCAPASRWFRLGWPHTRRPAGRGCRPRPAQPRTSRGLPPRCLWTAEAAGPTAAPCLGRSRPPGPFPGCPARSPSHYRGRGAAAQFDSGPYPAGAPRPTCTTRPSKSCCFGIGTEDTASSRVDARCQQASPAASRGEGQEAIGRVVVEIDHSEWRDWKRRHGLEGGSRARGG